MTKILFILSVLSLIASGCSNANIETTMSNDFTAPQFNHKITIGSNKLFVALADTPETRAQGLSSLEKIEDNQGMLFDYRSNAPVRPGFWMKDMWFPIDIIWIREGKIVGITPNVPIPQANQELAKYYPPEPVDMVLEINAGIADKIKLHIGHTVAL